MESAVPFHSGLARAQRIRSGARATSRRIAAWRWQHGNQRQARAGLPARRYRSSHLHWAPAVEQVEHVPLAESTCSSTTPASLRPTGGVLNETAAIWDGNTVETHLERQLSCCLRGWSPESMVKRESGGKISQRPEHVLDLRIPGLVPSYGGAAKERHRAAHEVSGHRVGQSWHQGQRDRARAGLKSGHDGCRAQRSRRWADAIRGAHSLRGVRGNRKNSLVAAVFLASRGADFIAG